MKHPVRRGNLKQQEWKAGSRAQTPKQQQQPEVILKKKFSKKIFSLFRKSFLD
jgi:hypothetical protein